MAIKFWAATAVAGSTHSCECSVPGLPVPALCTQRHSVWKRMQAALCVSMCANRNHHNLHRKWNPLYSVHGPAAYPTLAECDFPKWRVGMRQNWNYYLEFLFTGEKKEKCLKGKKPSPSLVLPGRTRTAASHGNEWPMPLFLSCPWQGRAEEDGLDLLSLDLVNCCV